MQRAGDGGAVKGFIDDLAISTWEQLLRSLQWNILFLVPQILVKSCISIGKAHDSSGQGVHTVLLKRVTVPYQCTTKYYQLKSEPTMKVIAYVLSKGTLIYVLCDVLTGGPSSQSYAGQVISLGL